MKFKFRAQSEAWWNLNLIISNFRISAVYASGSVVDFWTHGGVLLGRRGEYGPGLPSLVGAVCAVCRPFSLFCFLAGGDPHAVVAAI